MGSRVHKYHGRANRTQRLKRQRIINIITLIFICCVGILILGIYGVIPTPNFINFGQVNISSNVERPENNVESEIIIEKNEITDDIEGTENTKNMENTEKIENTEMVETTEEITEAESSGEQKTTEPEQAVTKEDILAGIDVNKPMIALTFDDGPSQYTWPILAALDSVGGRATFFVVGNRVASHNAALQQILAVGCEIGNHSYSHPDLTKLDAENMKAQIQTTDNALEKAVQIKTNFLRPPYGAVNDQLFELAEKPLILWSVDPKDWQNRDKDYLVEYMMLNAHDGDIILLHDIHETTALAAQEFIPKLAEKGYQLVTVSELLAAKGVEAVPGKIYRGRVFR